MAKFCENCPMHGACTAELIGAVEGKIHTKFLWVEKDIGNVATLVDSDRNISEPIYAPIQDAQERLIERVDNCTEPQTEEYGIFKKRQELICPAVGSLAVQEPEVRNYFLKRAQVEVI